MFYVWSVYIFEVTFTDCTPDFHFESTFEREAVAAVVSCITAWPGGLAREGPHSVHLSLTCTAHPSLCCFPFSLDFSFILHFSSLFCPLFFLSRFYFSFSLGLLHWLIASINVTVGLCVIATNAALPSLREETGCCSTACWPCAQPVFC